MSILRAMGVLITVLCCFFSIFTITFLHPVFFIILIFTNLTLFLVALDIE